jgi:hypothetical protein
MRERRPITSVKRADQKIGYTEGDQAFDLFARPCASYDHATGLLRDLNTQMIVGYVSLKGSFVGSSLVAEELFPTPLQNGGEPLDHTFLSTERVPSDDSSSQGERELQGKRLQIEPEDLIRPSLQDERASSDRPALQDVPETHQPSLHGGREALHEPDVEDERPLDESSLRGEREQPSESSLQREPEPLPKLLEGVASAALSGSREDDPERSSSAVDPEDSSALRGVDTFMLNLAEYLRSPGAAETATELSNHDEGKPCDSQNAPIQTETLSATEREPNSVNGQEGLQTEPGSDDYVAGAPANLYGAVPVLPSPGSSAPDASRPPSSLESEATTDADNGQSERHEEGLPSAADENRSDTDIQRGQAASDLDPPDVDSDSALDAVKNELKDAERAVARQVSNLTKRWFGVGRHRQPRRGR